MDFSLSPEQRIFRDSVDRLAADHLKAGALQRAHASAYPWDVAALFARHELLGITIDEASGGQGGTVMDAILAIESVAKHCPRSADVVQAGNFGAIRVLAEYATADQKTRYLQPLMRGEGVISVAMTEPEAGSSVTDLTTTATPDGGGYRVNGSKIFVTHSPEATVFLVYVRYGPGVDGIGAVLVERGTDGFTFGPPSRFMSGEDWCQLYFSDVCVRQENVLLGPGGFKKLIAGFNVERLGNTARSLALGRHAFELARAHAMIRRQFGRLLCEFQGLQWKFAEMQMQLEAGQLLLYRAAANADRGLPSPYETAMAKAFCNRAGFEVANESLQIMGAQGYTDDTLAEYCVRRTRGWMIAGGSIEMMKNRLAEGIFDRRFSQRPPKGACS